MRSHRRPLLGRCRLARILIESSTRGDFQQALSLVTLAVTAVKGSASSLSSWVTRDKKCQEGKKTAGICAMSRKQSRNTTAQALLVIVTPPAAPVKQCHKIPQYKNLY